jgi:GT2 family glycosyltransferase
MTSVPTVSVVMSVHNGGRYLRESVQSILAQEGVSFELVMVDDGSTDGSTAIMEDFARRDPRVRLLRQRNVGLTEALIRACVEARGHFIARQDADDLSLPGRLQHQAAWLESQPLATLVGCWTRMIGPDDEELLIIERREAPEEATKLLRSSTVSQLKGIAGHGSAMFRRADYLLAGGYRPEFYFAQDLDLWLRLTERGLLAFVPAVLYAWRHSPGSITGRFRSSQVALAHIALELAQVRRRGGSETALLDKAMVIRPGLTASVAPDGDFAGHYFIGKLLLKRRDRRCLGYLWRAVGARPWHLRALAALAQGLVLTRATR